MNICMLGITTVMLYYSCNSRQICTVVVTVHIAVGMALSIKALLVEGIVDNSGCDIVTGRS